MRLLTPSAYVFCTALGCAVECVSALQTCGEDVCIRGEGENVNMNFLRLQVADYFQLSCCIRRRAQPGGWGERVWKI